MNKLVKGSIAGAAGIALLLGGAGTFALWNDAETVNAGTIATGELDIALSGTGSWVDASPEYTTPVAFNPTTEKIVPGDTIRFTQNVSIKATGKNLKAELSYNAGSIVINPALTSHVTVALTASKLTGDATIAANGANKYTITPGATGTSTYAVTIEVKFDKNTPTAQVGQNQASGVNLTAASFTLNQVRP